MRPLRNAWLDKLAATPGMRTLDVARALEVSEAELLFSRVGDDATLLRPDWIALLNGLPALGRVMCLTRNAHVVHERDGAYERVEASFPMSGVYGRDIDQRLILSRWGFAIAAPVETRRGAMDSIQIFDTAGAAVLKIYAREQTDREAWAALVQALRAPEPPPALELKPLPKPAERADEDIDVDGLRGAWAAMRDTHDVHILLRRLGVGRVQALRLLGAEWAARVTRPCLQALLEGAAADAEPLMIFVGNTGCIQIHSGLIHRVVATNGWLNVLDPDFNLHAREAGLDAAWIVRKPTDRGLVWSLEVYDEDRSTLLQLFGKRTEAQSQRESWHERLAHLQARFSVE